MTELKFAPVHLAAIRLATLLACSAFTTWVHADEGGDQTLGVESSVKLPPQARGNPPSWAGKAFRQGVVAVANPYGAEAGAQILEQGGKPSTQRWRLPMRSMSLNRSQPASVAADS